MKLRFARGGVIPSPPRSACAAGALAACFACAFPHPAAALDTPTTVEVYDHADKLSPSEEKTLRQEAAALAVPANVNTIVFATYATNAEDLTETIDQDFRVHHPSLMLPDGSELGPGVVVLGTGEEPPNMAVTCGDDVCTTLDIDGPGRVDGILDQLEPPLARGNYLAGFLNGAKATMNTEIRRDSGPNYWVWTIFVIVSVSLLLKAGLGFWWWRRRHHRSLESQRFLVNSRAGEVKSMVERGNAQLAALTSPLRTPDLITQWEAIASAATEPGGPLEQASQLSTHPQFGEVLLNARSITGAYHRLMQLTTALRQLEDLSRFEAGELVLRHRELDELLQDVELARSRTAHGEEGLNARLHQIATRVEHLRADAAGTDFPGHFARILRDYHAIIVQVPEEYFVKPGPGQTTASLPPLLGDELWRPGMGTHYLPFHYCWQWVRKTRERRNLFEAPALDDHPGALHTPVAYR